MKSKILRTLTPYAATAMIFTAGNICNYMSEGDKHNIDMPNLPNDLNKLIDMTKDAIIINIDNTFEVLKTCDIKNIEYSNDYRFVTITMVDDTRYEGYYDTNIGNYLYDKLDVKKLVKNNIL